MREPRADKAAHRARAYTCAPRLTDRSHWLKFQAPRGVFVLSARCFRIMEFVEDLSPAQLRALLPKMMNVIRSRRASLLAELESMGGQAPTTADFPEPSRDELEREANAAALRQLVLRAKSQWKEERAALRAAIKGAKEFASLRGERRWHTAIALARRDCAKDLWPP